MTRTDTRHDVLMVAIAMFGATAATVGLPSSVIVFPASAAAALTAGAAIFAASVLAAVDDDVTPTEVAVAAVIAVPLCVGVDWFAGRWAPREPMWTIGATLGAGAGAWLAARRGVSTSWGYRMLFAGFVSGGILAVLVLFGLFLHGVIGAKLNLVPWLASALSGAMLAWRAPQLSPAHVFVGTWLATLGTSLVLIPAAHDEMQPIGLVVFVMVIIAAIFAGIAVGAHQVVGKRLRSLPRARVR